MAKNDFSIAPAYLKAAFSLSAIVCLAVACFVGLAEAAETEKPSLAGKYPAFGLAEKENILEQGKKVYATYCAGCHGTSGDGNGPAASQLDPKPRNFTLAQFRFSSRPSGDLPTDEDLFRTVTEGLKGTSMPGWPLLPEADRRAVITYIKNFAPDKWENSNPSLPTVIADDPYYGQDKAQAIRRGEAVYHGIAQCYSCHAGYLPPEKINQARAETGMSPMEGFREDFAHSRIIQNEDGSFIKPPDFTWDRLKRGADLQTLYQVIGNGIGGVAMPTWKSVFPEEDLWGLAYYVQDQVSKRPRRVTESDLRVRREKTAALGRQIVQYNQKTQAEMDAKAAQAAQAASPAATPAT